MPALGLKNCHQCCSQLFCRGTTTSTSFSQHLTCPCAKWRPQFVCNQYSNLVMPINGPTSVQIHSFHTSVSLHSCLTTRYTLAALVLVWCVQMWESKKRWLKTKINSIIMRKLRLLWRKNTCYKYNTMRTSLGLHTSGGGWSGFFELFDLLML